MFQIPRSVCTCNDLLVSSLVGKCSRSLYSTAATLHKVTPPTNKTNNNNNNNNNTKTTPKSPANFNKPNGYSKTSNNNNNNINTNKSDNNSTNNDKEIKNLQRNRAKLGPKPQKKTEAKKARTTALSLLEELRENIKLKNINSHNIQRKVFFGLTIPSTPKSVADELFQIAVDHHEVDYRILNGYLGILSEAQDLDAVQKVFTYLQHIGYNPQYTHYKCVLKCWIGPKRLDMQLLDKNFETIKSLVSKDLWDHLYAIYMSVFIHQSNFEEGKKIIEKMREEGITPSKSFYGEIITAMVENKHTTEEMLQGVLLMMDKDNIPPDRRTCNAVINFYVKKGNFSKAIQVGEMMEESGIPFYDDAFVPLIDGFRKEGILEGIVYIISELGKRKIPLSKSLYTSVIAAYCEKKDMESAKKVLQSMFDSKVNPEAPTYNCMIKGFLWNDDLPGGVNMLLEMKNAKVMPNAATYPLFIEYFRRKEDFANMKQILQMMRDDFLPINVISYAVAITVAVKNFGYGEEARELMQKMKEERVEPTKDFFSSIITALAKKKDGSAFLELMDEMDSSNVPYHPSTISPILFYYTSSHSYPLAWQVMERIMTKRFDLKTLPLPQKRALKQLGFMHHVENGEFKDNN